MAYFDDIDTGDIDVTSSTTGYYRGHSVSYESDNYVHDDDTGETYFVTDNPFLRED